MLPDDIERLPEKQRLNRIIATGEDAVYLFSFIIYVVFFYGYFSRIIFWDIINFFPCQFIYIRVFYFYIIE